MQYLITSTWWCSCPSTQMKPLMISRHVGRRWWWRVLITYNLVLLGQHIFGLIIANSVSKGSSFQVCHNLKPFCDGCMFTFHTYSNYIMGWKYVVHVHAKLWMVGLCRVPHLDQDTQANIKSYLGVLKRWFFLETKGLKGCCINWLVWRLTTIVPWHYMHQAEMKRQGFIKNKVMAWLVVASVDKVSWIPHINVISPTFEGDDGDGVWWVRRQHHLGVTYKICAPFIKYANCNYGWALRNNFCKHQIVVILMCTNLITKNLNIAAHIMELAMVVWNACLLTWHDGAFNNEDCNQSLINEVNIVDIGGFMAMDEDSCFDNADFPEGSFAPMDQTLRYLHEIMAEIITKCTTSASVEFYDHATSLLLGVGSNIHHFCLVQINKSMHSGMVFCRVDDGFGNSINRMKD